MDKEYNGFAERFKSKKAEYGFTNYALARKINSSAQLLDKYDSGTVAPGADKLWKLADALGVNVEWLWTGRGPEFSDKSESYASSSGDDIPDDAKKPVRRMIFEIDKLQDPRIIKKIMRTVKTIIDLPKSKIDIVQKMVEALKKEKTETE